MKCIPFILCGLIIVTSVKFVKYYDHNELIDTAVNFSRTEQCKSLNRENIIINDSNTSAILNLYKEPQKYEGKSIKINGCVCRHNINKDNLFVLRKTIYHCCINDSINMGIYVFSDKASLLSENAETQIEGIIKIMKINNKGEELEVPVIKAEKIEL